MSPTTSVRTHSPTRFLNILLGSWLFVSAFLWPHNAEQYSNTWLTGALCVILSVVAMAVPWARYLVTALAVWLFISAFALPSENVGTVWNNALVAIAVFIVSILPAERPTRFVQRPTQTTPTAPA
jgi:hypothetical protein